MKLSERFPWAFVIVSYLSSPASAFYLLKDAVIRAKNAIFDILLPNKAEEHNHQHTDNQVAATTTQHLTNGIDYTFIPSYLLNSQNLLSPITPSSTVVPSVDSLELFSPTSDRKVVSYYYHLSDNAISEQDNQIKDESEDTKNHSNQKK